MMIERTNKRDGKGIQEKGWKEMQMPTFMQAKGYQVEFSTRVTAYTAINMVSYNSSL
jgi:hypothetical protein